MEKKRFIADDGWSFTYSPTETKITEISMTRLVEYAITGDYGGSAPLERDRDTVSGCSGGMKVRFVVSEQTFGVNHFGTPHADIESRVLKQLVNLDAGYCPDKMGPLMREVVDEAIAELGIDTTTFLIAMSRQGVPWSSVGEFVTAIYAVQQAKYRKMVEDDDDARERGELVHGVRGGVGQMGGEPIAKHATDI